MEKKTAEKIITAVQKSLTELATKQEQLSRDLEKVTNFSFLRQRLLTRSGIGESALSEDDAITEVDQIDTEEVLQIDALLDAVATTHARLDKQMKAYGKDLKNTSIWASEFSRREA